MRAALQSCLFAMSLCLGMASPIRAAELTVSGDWSGVLDVGLMKLTLVLHISQNDSGKLSATLDSLEQGATGIEVDTIAFAGNKVHFEIAKLKASFDGDVEPNGQSIKGTFTQGQAFELEFTRGIKAAQAMKRPQMPKGPYFYQEEQVKFANPRAGVTLAGTLTLPFEKRAHPAVILIQGSGPIDRDETVVGHKPFWVLADHLSNQGIAVLRFDKRGIGQSTGNYEAATSEDFKSDVEAAIAYLKTRTEIDSSNIGLIGHSEGGLVAPMVAGQSHDVAFIVLMAGTGVKGEDILLEQGALVQRAEGLPEAYIEGDTRFRGQLMRIAKTQRDVKQAESEMNQAIEAYFSNLSEVQTRALGKVTKEDVQKSVALLLSPWIQFFLVYDPVPALRELKIPVLVLFGENDLQVPPKQNMPPILQALKDAKNTHFMGLEIPKLNHLFQTSQTGAVSEYAKIEETISPVALNLISGWIASLNLSQYRL